MLSCGTEWRLQQMCPNEVSCFLNALTNEMSDDFSPTGLRKTTDQVRHHQLHDVQSAPVCVCVCVVILVSGTCHAVILPGVGSASLTVIPSIIMFMFLQLVVLSSDRRTVLLSLLMSLPITPPSPPLPEAPRLMSGTLWRRKMTLDFVFVAVNGVIYQKRPKRRLSGQRNSCWWSLSSVYEPASTVRLQGLGHKTQT